MEKQFEEMYDQVFDLIGKGRTAEAMDIAQKLVDANMSNEAAWFAYAHAKKEWGDSALAVKGFEQAIAINPEFVQGYIELAWFYGENEQSDVAIKYAQKALEISPTNVEAMDCVVRSLYDLEGIESAIAKCTEYIDMADEKIELQNLLGKLYVDKARLYVVDVPDDFQDPGCETTPGFVSLEDINDVRNYCNKAKSLLTLDRYKDDLEMADILLGVCDEDCELEACHKKGYTVFHSIIVFIFYTLITLIWGAPLGIAAAIFTVKADKFPRYVYNYVWCTGSDDPLKYSRDSFYSNHDTLKAMADGAKEGWDSAGGSSDSIWSGLLKDQFWFLKARIQFYKRSIKEKKEQKKNA